MYQPSLMYIHIHIYIYICVFVRFPKISLRLADRDDPNPWLLQQAPPPPPPSQQRASANYLVIDKATEKDRTRQPTLFRTFSLKRAIESALTAGGWGQPAPNGPMEGYTYLAPAEDNPSPLHLPHPPPPLSTSRPALRPFGQGWNTAGWPAGTRRRNMLTPLPPRKRSRALS